MKFILGFFLLLTASFLPENIYEINTLKENAEFLHKKGNYKEALVYYKELVELRKNKEPAILLNYAHTLLQTKDSLSARGMYNVAIKNIQDPAFKSVAYAQAGIIEFEFNKNKAEAIRLFQLALRADDRNSAARHNLYILLKLKNPDDDEEHTNDRPLKNKSSGSGAAGNEDENNPIGASGSLGNQGGEETTVNNFQELNMTADKARQLLDAMQKNEIQYIQQLKRKEDPIDKQDVNRPDW